MNKAGLHNEIAEVAYQLYVKRGRVHGNAEQDWLAAEKIVLSRHSATGQESTDTPKKTAKKRTAATLKTGEIKPAAKKPAARGRKPSTKKGG